MRTYDRLFIGGEWVASSGTQVIDVISPHTEQTIGGAPVATETDIDHAVRAARAAFDDGEWPRLTPSERADYLKVLATAYSPHIDEMAELITEEMGSPISYSKIGQAFPGLMIINTGIKVAAGYPWEETRRGDLADTVVRRTPVGVVAAIVPWNMPQLGALTKMVPALLAGCTVVLKPAAETPVDALRLAEIIDGIGLPKGVVNIVTGGRDVGEHLIRHLGVDKVSFTGSSDTGRQIASQCADQLKRVSLELGGKSAAIVLDDADIAAMAQALRFASFANNGEACVAQTRILAPSNAYDAIVDAVANLAASLVVGDPTDPRTEIGPLVTQRQQQRVEKYIALGQEEGARVVVGGNGMPNGLDTGWYVRPTVFADVDSRMRIAQEEIFGPVLTVIPYDDIDDAVRIANDSRYGLAGTVWTGDVERGMDVARRIRTGSVGINQYMPDLAAPLGGFKDSGIGREGGPEGLDQYVELQSLLPGVRT
ncbi:aldehyde dehydrogenase [Mycobacterium sp. WUMAC-067]|uniref:aldehyde dehydrogenase n=1 Tax=unclassified Mycobacterium TaxID=2642494 RepID=UPI001CD9886E|nr:MULTISPECIES: aldehyde dehydrogenase [unclassified Mycobacterium]MCA2245453.1 aldehyde dehydrogenase [Mycobacterium sp. WUMAC-067]MCA2316989.1 aldehyde dehydrogenase [Mycobacterium sp. WUMAC-025]